MANKSKFYKQNNEIKRSLINQHTYSNNAFSSSAKKASEEYDNTGLSPQDESLLKQVNERRKARGAKPLTKRQFAEGNV